MVCSSTGASTGRLNCQNWILSSIAQGFCANVCRVADSYMRLILWDYSAASGLQLFILFGFIIYFPIRSQVGSDG